MRDAADHVPDHRLTLAGDDPRVVAARAAEEALYARYGLRPAETWLDTAFGRLRVLTFGRGEPLLLVPGNTGDVYPLASLIARLTGRAVIAVNRPGGGLSEGMDHREVDIRRFAVDTLTRVLDSFHLRQVPVLAHSMGAHWSLWLALDRPERVSRVITMGNPGNVMLDTLPPALALMGKAPWNRWMLKLIAPRSPRGMTRLFKAMGMTRETMQRLPPELYEAYYRFLRLPNYIVSATSLMENLAPRLEVADLCRIRVPVMLLWGSNDTFAGLDTACRIAKALPQGRLVTIAGASHLPWLGEEKACADPILEFLHHREVHASH